MDCDELPRVHDHALAASRSTFSLQQPRSSQQSRFRMKVGRPEISPPLPTLGRIFLHNASSFLCVDQASQISSWSSLQFVHRWASARAFCCENCGRAPSCAIPLLSGVIERTLVCCDDRESFESHRAAQSSNLTRPLLLGLGAWSARSISPLVAAPLLAFRDLTPCDADAWFPAALVGTGASRLQIGIA